jgi:general secretion pathway protein D
MGGKDERMKVSGHIDEPVPAKEQIAMSIPPIVEQVPEIVPPKPVEKLQTFTVVATDLPANELLFALARDARLNLDIDPSISDRVSINAIDQTLPQILKRISRQVSLRYYMDGPNLVVEKDKEFTRVYKIDYLNMARTTSSSIGVTNQIGGGSDGGSSSTTVSNESNNDFWTTLEANIQLLASSEEGAGTVISNRESGTISVLASSSAHENIQRFVDQVMKSARRQVLIEATVVEVTLSDDFQAGVDWSRIASNDGWSLQQNVLGGALSATPFVSAEYTDSNADRDINAAVKALDSFGDVSVMSSPKIMALNNQTSILKVVDNRVYFTTDVSVTPGNDNTNALESISTTVNTVPVGFIMNVTPYITDNNEVILNIRPTISRISGFVADPNPALVIESLIPQIQIREMESVLRVSDGNTAVIGGLMQDAADKSTVGIPGLHDSEGFGFLFGTRSRELTKTELVIFLRPRILDNANVETNLQDFKRLLQPESLMEQSN